MISSFLVSFIENLLSLNYWSKCFNSLVMLDYIVPNFLLGYIKSVSSAKWWMIDLENTNYRSLIYKRSNKSLRVDPPGTSHVIVLMLDKSP